MEEIDAQIAQLQQKKIQILFELEVIERRRGLTKDGQHRILAKPSPSPKKKKVDSLATSYGEPVSLSFAPTAAVQSRMIVSNHGNAEASTSKQVIIPLDHIQLKPLAPIRKSNYIARVKTIGKESKENAARRDQPRTTGFTAEPVRVIRPPPPPLRLPSPPVVIKSEKSTSAMSRWVKPASVPKAKASTRELVVTEPVYHNVGYSDEEMDRSEEENDDDEDGLQITEKPKRTRHKDGTTIERLAMGPIHHRPLENDPGFETIEPNSGIRLKSRILSHAKLQIHLSDRFHLTPSLLYSIVRPSKGGGNLDVPLVGDFIVIGVLAEKGEISYINANALKKDVKEVKTTSKWETVRGVLNKDLDEAAEDERAGKGEEDDEQDDTFRRPSRAQKKRRFIKFSLVDLATPSAAAAGTGTLTMLLFESDSQDVIEEEGGKRKGSYRGGSGGAYEKWWKESEGAVIAVLNPKVLKQMPGQPLAISPDSADSIILIGRSKDYRSCSARKQDQKICGKLFDGRSEAEACLYHSQLRLRRTAANRPETSSTTTSLGSTTLFDQKSFANTFKPNASRSFSSRSSSSAQPDYEKKIGLLPRQSNRVVIDGVVTYTTAGSGTGTSLRSVARASANDLRAAAITSGGGSSAMMGNSTMTYSRNTKGITVAQAERDRATRKVERATREREMELLVSQNGDHSLGAMYVRRVAERKTKMKEEAKQAREERRRRKRKRQEESSTDEDSDEENDEKGANKGKEAEKIVEVQTKRKNPFSVEALRLIGFDPTRNGTIGQEEDKLEKLLKPRSATTIALTNLPSNRPIPSLSAPPGKKIRSGVFVPVPAPVEVPVEEYDEEESSSAESVFAGSDGESHKLKANYRMKCAFAKEEEDDDDDDDLDITGRPE